MVLSHLLCHDSRMDQLYLILYVLFEDLFTCSCETEVVTKHATQDQFIIAVFFFYSIGLPTSNF